MSEKLFELVQIHHIQSAVGEVIYYSRSLLGQKPKWNQRKTKENWKNV